MRSNKGIRWAYVEGEVEHEVPLLQRNARRLEGPAGLALAAGLGLRAHATHDPQLRLDVGILPANRR